MFNENLFAKKLDRLTPYAVDKGIYKARLDANESFVSVPENIREQLGKALFDFDFNRYPDSDASELVSAFCEFYGLNEKCVAAGNGSDEIISLIMSCFADFGSTVMTQSPDFSMYAFYASLYGLTVVECPKDEKFHIDFEKSYKTIKENNVKLVIFSNPCNPTGKIEAKKNIVSLAEKCPETIFVVDEAYMEFAEFKVQESLLKETEKYQNIVVLKTLSKAFGAASLRLGFVVCDELFVNKFKAVKSPYNVNGVSQLFGKILLQNKEELSLALQNIVKSTNNLYNGIVDKKIACPDETFANFVFFEDDRAFDKYTYLKENGFLVRYFKTGKGALRITAGTIEQNDCVIKLLSDFK